MSFQAHHQKTNREQGQGLAEYALILTLVGVVAIVILSVLGGAVGNVFENITCSLETPDQPCAPKIASSESAGGGDNGGGDTGGGDNGGGDTGGGDTGGGDTGGGDTGGGDTGGGDTGGGDTGGGDTGGGDTGGGDTGGGDTGGGDTGGGDTGGGDTGGGDTGGGDTGGGDTGGGDTGGGDTGGGDTGGGGSSNVDPNLNPIGNLSVNEGTTAVFTLTATDPDIDPLVFSASGLTGSFMTLTDNGNNTATLTLTPGYNHANVYTVSFTVGDGNGGLASETVQITVNNIDPDTDGDGVSDSSDNCPDTANAGQGDSDNDGKGNVCDYSYRYNIGANAVTGPDSNGNMWQPESGTSSSNGTVYKTSTNSSISGTTDDFLYQVSSVARSGGTGKNLTWQQTGLPNGTYTVYLYFAETDSGHVSRFDIYVQDDRIKRRYRPNDEGYRTASVVTATEVEVTNGVLEVELRSYQSAYTRLSAVYITGAA